MGGVSPSTLLQIHPVEFEHLDFDAVGEAALFLGAWRRSRRSTPELPPGSMCFHSMWRTKFSYWRSVRMTPMGWPEQMSTPSLTDQVYLSVLTLTQPVRSLPLKRSWKVDWAGSWAAAVRARRRMGSFMLI